MIGWKVVHQTGKGTLTSAFEHPKLWRRRYKVGLRTRGYKGTPVLAFSTRRNARRFCSQVDRGRVFKATLENPRPQEDIAYADYPDKFAAFWEGTERLFTWPSPGGTLACDAITLLEPA